MAGPSKRDFGLQQDAPAELPGREVLAAHADELVLELGEEVNPLDVVWRLNSRTPLLEAIKIDERGILLE